MPPDQELIFTISPVVGSTDWDFAMWGPDVPCDQLDDAGMVRCNFDAAGTTGLSFTPGGAFDSHLVVQPGQGFFLMLNNFWENTTPFSIDWGGSAAPYLNCLPECDLVADAGEDISICDGESFNLSATLTGGDGNDTIRWSASPNDILQYIADTTAANTSVNIPAGDGTTFQFVVTYISGVCRTTDTIVVNEDVPVPTFTDTTLAHVTDCMTPNGQIDVIASGSNLEYSIDGGMTWGTTSTFSDLDAGAYTLQVRDATHPMCTDMINLVIDDITPPSISDVMITPLIDCDSSDAVITIMAAGSSIEYSIDNGATWQSDSVFANLTHGTYPVAVRLLNNSSCIATMDVEIVNPDCACDVVFTPTINEITCFGANSGSITIAPSEAINAPTMTWNTGVAGFEINELAIGTYRYELNYNDFCVYRDTFELTQPEEIQYELTASDATCTLNPDGSISIANQSGGTGVLTFTINDDPMGADEFTALLPGNYRVTATDEAGCMVVRPITVPVAPKPVLLISAPEVIEAGEPLTISGSYTGITADSVRWITSDSVLTSASTYETIATLSNEYTFQLFYTNCMEELSQEITVIPPSFYLPNAFSPNDNGINERFFLQAKNRLTGVRYDLSVYNRWGNQVFSQKQLQINNSDQGWNGLINGKEANMGVYVYEAIVYFDENKPRRLNGSLLLVR